MPIYEFQCPDHGPFEVPFPIKGMLPRSARCTSLTRVASKKAKECGKKSPRYPSVPGAIIVEGGTGACRAPRKE